MEDSFNIEFSNSNERIVLKIKDSDIDKFTRMIYEMCLDNKIHVDISKYNKNEDGKKGNKGRA